MMTGSVDEGLSYVNSKLTLSVVSSVAIVNSPKLVSNESATVAAMPADVTGLIVFFDAAAMHCANPRSAWLNLISIVFRSMMLIVSGSIGTITSLPSTTRTTCVYMFGLFDSLWFITHEND